MCVCEMRVESAAAAASAAGEKMDGWMCSAVRIKRSPLSPPPVYVADNQTGFVSSTARVCVCVLLLPCGCSFVRVCASIILSSSSSQPRSHLSSSLSPSVYFFSSPADPCTDPTCTPF